MLRNYLEKLDELRSQVGKYWNGDNTININDIRKNIKTTKNNIVKELGKLGYNNNVKSLLNIEFNISFTGEYREENINYRNFKPKFYYEDNRHILIFGSTIKNYYCLKSNNNKSMELAYIIDKETNTTIYENWSIRSDHKLSTITNYLTVVANILCRKYNLISGE